MMSVRGVSDHAHFGKPLTDDAPSGFQGGSCSKGKFLAGQRPKAKASSELQSESVDSRDQEFRQLLTFCDEEPCPSEGPAFVKGCDKESTELLCDLSASLHTEV